MKGLRLFSFEMACPQCSSCCHNLVNPGKFELEAGDGAAKVSIAPEQGGLLETTEINGRKYLLAPAEGLHVNGLPVQE